MAAAIAESDANQWAFDLLQNVPGLPPITQAVHILGIAVVMASSVMIDLRILGLAVPSQNLTEMVQRLMPWTWIALAINLLTGLPFILARPYRYFLNPVFAWKIVFLVPAVVLAVVIYRRLGRTKAESSQCSDDQRPTTALKFVAAASLVLWIGVILAGRWIAYSDYLFWPE